MIDVTQAYASPGSPHPATLHDAEQVFADSEWLALHGQDFKAAKIIVSLMVTIFTIGLAMYCTICLIAAQ